jgi:uncharacterized Ntn-hydrolase superfamily protein
MTDILVDLRVDDHAQPIVELERLYRMHDRLFGRTPRDRWLPVDDTLRAELAGRLAALGYAGAFAEQLDAWAGTENLEERLDGVDTLDPVLVEALREA